MNREKNSMDGYKNNIKRYLLIILIEVFAVGFTLILLGEYKSEPNTKKASLEVKEANAEESTTEQESNVTNKQINKEINKETNKETNKMYDSVDKSDTNTSKMESTTSKDRTEIVTDIKGANSDETVDSTNKSNVTTTKLSKEEKQQLKEVNEIIKNMTLEEKICQMFIISPEALTNYNNVTAAGTKTKNAIDKYHVAGVIYFSGNIKSENQLKKLLTNTQQYATADDGIPMFIGIDEEGGEVARIGNNPKFNATKFKNLSTVSSKEEAYKIGNTIGKYLSNYGFNIDFAPDSDVLTNKKNTVVKNRAFSSSAKKVVAYASAYASGLNDENLYATYKHFPGHGSTVGDSHKGFAYTNKTYAQLEKADLVPFIDGIKNGIDLIMVAHISVPNVIGDNTPSSLSKVMVTDILRGKLGYEGVIITDAMNMGAISQNYTVEQSTTKAVKAGCDIILMPDNFREAYNSLIKAVKNGEISEERIDESVRRVLLLKKKRMNW
jgi:beta-N-acetylhexosaminidase